VLKSEPLILLSLLSLLLGAVSGIMISILQYPKWEVMKIFRKYKQDGYSFGEWNHLKELADHNMKAIVKPNCETLYSVSFIRRSDGPYILNMPAFDSYFSFAFLGMNTDVLGYITNRDAIENYDNTFIISYCAEEISDVMLPGIRLDCDLCWIIGRFEIKRAEDIARVNEIQDGVSLIKLKDYLNGQRKKD